MIGSMLRAGVQGAVTQEPTKDEQNQDAACTVPVERLPNCFLMQRERERSEFYYIRDYDFKKLPAISV